MAFLYKNIVGNGIAQVAVTNDATVEAVVNSLVANNTSAGALNFSVLIDDVVVFTESVGANGTFRIPDKVNLGALSVLKVEAPIGISVGVSYLQQAIDVAGALSAAQALVVAVSADADRAEAALGTTSNPVITGSITEEVYNLTGTELNPSNGTVQYKTLTADVTFTDALTSGQSMLLRIAGGDTYAVTFPSAKFSGGVAPTLTADDSLVIWKEQTQLYIAYVGTLVQA